jgi:hypothetical protein
MSDNARVMITIPYPNDHESMNHVRIRVEDAASSMMVCELKIPVAEFLAALRGLYLGEVPVVYGIHPDRFGTKMQTRSMNIKRSMFERLAYKAQDAAVEEFAKQQAKPGESVSVSRTNTGGWEAIFRSWPKS